MGPGLRFETMEHGAEYPDTTPQAIKLVDDEGRSCICVPITQNGKVVDSQAYVFDQMTNEAVRPSLARQIVDPIKGSKDLSIASKIIFSRSNTEKMSALLVSHSAPDTLRKKRKLVFRRLFARPSIVVGSPDFRTSFFCFRPRVPARPPISIFAPLSSQPRSLFRRNITLSAPTFRALKNIMDKTGLLDFLARGSHFNIASDAERIVFRWLDHARASPGSGSRFYVRSLA
jgi:hypothetical protein